MANEAKEKLIACLNDDLALELAGIVRAIYQASTAGGLLGHELRELLEKELPVEVQHAQFLSDKIAILGGNPTTSIAEVALPATSAPEFLEASTVFECGLGRLKVTVTSVLKSGLKR